MTKRYEPHPTDEGKFQSVFDEYGHGEGNGKTRQSINRRWRQTEKAKNEAIEASEPRVEATNLDESPTEEAGEGRGGDSSVHEWLSIPSEDGGESKVEALVSPAQGLLRAFTSKGEVAPKSKAELEAWNRQQARLIRYIFSGAIDPLVSAYGRGVMGEKGKDWKIERTPDEWEVFEAVTTQWVEHHQLSLDLNPNLLMAGAVLTYYVPPVTHIHRNRDPEKPSVFRRMKNRVVKWRAKRRLKKMGVEE